MRTSGSLHSNSRATSSRDRSWTGRHELTRIAAAACHRDAAQRRDHPGLGRIPIIAAPSFLVAPTLAAADNSSRRPA
ncbi:hypothetical protein OV203_31275 [Nannocystis sp. ILAH1]|uniref:hypothetical protein n=1 Tax=unclassified Nannocystis TaxID=2627009 RepID=UPI00226D721C|nr:MULTISPECIES: hypothetical protein [unclassified Nannocystis]MCY0991666.1 hypothetical protein [Nannocystis sp. ILAH1]MCY1067213.1 hypothetical protein [Nannocystis sp. RBIL2]